MEQITLQPEQITVRHHEPKHMPSLDGLRAISVFLVLLGHLCGTRNFFWKIHTAPLVGDFAHFGVNVFFVISGFLITSLLIKEYHNTGRISLKLFYGRRSLRIFPAASAFLCVLYLLAKVGAVELLRYDLLKAATYTMNYSVKHSWYVGHLWSLSVEEQFYLLWPFAFSLAGPSRAVKVAMAVVVASPVARGLAWIFLRHTPYFDLETFPVVADSLAAGCLLACGQGWLEAQPGYLRLFRPMASACVLSIVLVTNGLTGYSIIYPLGTTIVNIGIAILVHRSVFHADRGVGRLLNWKPLAFFGTLSYSLYLWQQLFLNRKSNGFEAAFPQNVIFAVGAAVLSYALLEKPLMALRHRLRVS